ncbi:tetratricopeptide repeat protein [Azospirillum sp. B510]|uniref:O-linked N-acetylglucosamine transferase, SPINDLY family protein n=2 Tax=Alphaproteobacteria TaxID=28211 RepID=UPI0002D8C2B1|nr:glycosyltransferase family 41 protein [Azospirillum sp. B510]
MTPDQAESTYRQGLIAAQAGRWAEAGDLLARAITARPGVAVWWANYGLVLESRGDPLGAAQAYAGALNLDGGLAMAMDGLLVMAETLAKGGRADLAEGCYRRALALAPATLAALVNAGNLLRAQARRADSIGLNRRAAILQPDSWIPFYNTGNALAEMNRPDEADRAFRAGLCLEPSRVELWANRAGLSLAPQARIGEALAALDRALRLSPGADSLHSARLFLMQYDPAPAMPRIAQAHADWGARYPDRPAAPVAAPSPRLRVGYVSADFRAHPVGYFLEPVLAAHDRGGIEAICYSNTANPDAVTARLRGLADGWVDCAGLDDAALLERIRADGIHILVDLAGHTLGNRLGVFARRAAPVQVTWAGYVGTTGLPAMDYLISDPRQSPEGADGWAIEGIVRMPDAYVPWVPPADAPAVAPLPMIARGAPTFGCLNALPKLNAPVAALWSRLLAAVPGARLLLRTPGLDDPALRARTLALFEAAGADPARIELRGAAPHAEFLATYGEIDVALDPFPYSGGLTTLEALWMGVPVVTLGGDRFCARHSVTHLTSAGLPALAVEGEEAYVAMAAALVSDPDGLASIRGRLRDRLATSPALDGVRFTRALEAAFGAMWQRAAAGQGRASFALNFD